jgi:hypothetical protein
MVCHSIATRHVRRSSTRPPKAGKIAAPPNSDLVPILLQKSLSNEVCLVSDELAMQCATRDEFKSWSMG